MRGAYGDTPTSGRPLIGELPQGPRLGLGLPELRAGLQANPEAPRAHWAAGVAGGRSRVAEAAGWNDRTAGDRMGPGVGRDPRRRRGFF